MAELLLDELLLLEALLVLLEALDVDDELLDELLLTELDELLLAEDVLDDDSELVELDDDKLLLELEDELLAELVDELLAELVDELDGLLLELEISPDCVLEDDKELLLEDDEELAELVLLLMDDEDELSDELLLRELWLDGLEGLDVLDRLLVLLLEILLVLVLSDSWDSEDVLLLVDSEDSELVELELDSVLEERLLVELEPDWLLSSVSVRPHTKIEYVTSPLNADSRTMHDEPLTGNASAAGLCSTKHVRPVASPLPLDIVGTQASLFAGSVPLISSLPLPPVCQMASVVISAKDSGSPSASLPSPAPRSKPVKSSRSKSSDAAAASSRSLLVQFRENSSSPSPDSSRDSAKIELNDDSATWPSSRVFVMEPVRYSRTEPDASRWDMGSNHNPPPDGRRVELGNLTGGGQCGIIRLKGESIMRLRNTTDFTDRFLRRMVAWCCRQLDMPASYVRAARFGNATNSWGGVAYLQSRRISVRVGSEAQVGHEVKHHKFGDGFQVITYTRLEVLLVTTAHELAHLDLYRRGNGSRRDGRSGGSERLTEGRAANVLEAFRRNVHLLDVWATEPAVRHRQIVQSVQEKRAAQAADKLLQWQRKAKLAATKIRKYRKQVRYYEKAIAAKRSV